MNSHFKETKSEVISEITALTVNTIETLTTLWMETFEPDLCENNLKKLSDHVRIFYGEVIDEMKKRQDRITMEIKKLHSEASDLKRLLNVDMDINPPNDMALYTMQNVMDENLQGLRKQLRIRRDQIYNLLVEQEQLCDELGEDARELHDDPLPTAAELNDFRNYLDGLIEEKENRMKTVAHVRGDILKLYRELELSLISETDCQLVNDPLLSLTVSNVNKLHELKDTLQKQLEDTKESIDGMKLKLEGLWNVLETSPSIKKKFEKYTGYSQTVYDKLYQELERCEVERRQNVKRFVDKAREEIQCWWDKTLRSDIERNRFCNFTSDCYTEDLLTLHEMELDDLKKFYFNNEKIFELIEERKTLWDRMSALEAKASEPGRYNNRGGQLLKEEKERKMISKKLPIIEQELIGLVQQYEGRHNKKFTVYGESVEEVIRKDWSQKEEAKEQLKSARKNQVTPFRTPLGKAPQSATKAPNSTLRNPNSSVKRFGSNTNLTAMQFTTTKRRLVLPENNHVKRSILSELGQTNPSVGTRSNTNTKAQIKLPTFNVVKRRSNRLSAGKSKSRRVSKGKVGKKRTATTTRLLNNSCTTSDSVNYDNFEDYIGSRSPCRSSIMNPNENRKPLPLPRTGKRNTPCIENTLVPKSPGLSRTRNGNRTPSPATGRKFTTTNLPILI